MKQENKIKVLFGTGRVDVVKNRDGQFKLRADRPGLLRRLMGKGTEIFSDKRGYYTGITPETINKMILGLLD